MTEKPMLSIIIPAYNEGKRIGPSLEKVDAFLNGVGYSIEVIVVNDASLDETSEVVRKFIQDKPCFRLIENITNLGKGASVQKGMLIAQGKFRLFADADMSTPIEEVDTLLSYLNPPDGSAPVYDVVIGSRRVPGSNMVVRQPGGREFAGRIFSVLVRMITLRGYMDTQCCFKQKTKKAANILFRFMTIPRFGFDVELLYIARKHELKVLEAPVRWFNSLETTVRLQSDAVQMLIDLFLIRWNNLLGAYK